MEEPEDRVDFERLRAEHPSWRLFQAHPALGLEETEDDHVWNVPSEKLGLRWFALPLAEQEAREADFLHALLEIAARDEDARFEAIPTRKGEMSAEIAEQTGGRVLDDGAVIGRLTAQAVDAFVASPRNFYVGRCAHLALMVDGPRAVGVWVDRSKVEQMESELEAAWWEPAQERERARAGQDIELRRRHALDRELRARVLLTWERRSGLLVVAAVFAAHALDWEPLGWFGTPVVIAITVIIALSQVEKAIDRWYRRAAEAS